MHARIPYASAFFSACSKCFDATATTSRRSNFSIMFLRYMSLIAPEPITPTLNFLVSFVIFYFSFLPSDITNKALRIFLHSSISCFMITQAFCFIKKADIVRSQRGQVPRLYRVNGTCPLDSLPLPSHRLTHVVYTIPPNSKSHPS